MIAANVLPKIKNHLQHSQLLQPLQLYLLRPQLRPKLLPESLLQCPTSVFITPLAIPENVRIASVSNAFKPDLVWDLSGPAESHSCLMSEDQSCFICLSCSLFVSITHLTQIQNKNRHTTVCFLCLFGGRMGKKAGKAYHLPANVVPGNGSHSALPLSHEIMKLRTSSSLRATCLSSHSSSSSRSSNISQATGVPLGRRSPSVCLLNRRLIARSRTNLLCSSVKSLSYLSCNSASGSAYLNFV